MDARLQWFREGLEGLSVQELKDMLVEEHAKRMQEHEERIREHEERMRENMRLLEFERSSAAMSREYQRIQDRLAAAEKELSKSRALCKKLQEQNDSLTKHRFGRHSEKTDVLFESADDPNEDPLAEEHMPEPEGRTLPPLNFEAAARKLAGKTGTRGSKRNGKRMDDLSRLEQVHRFDLDVGEMDKRFGKGRWTIINWHSYTTVKHVRETVYAETVHEPVIKQLDTGNLVSMPRPFVLYPYSFASPSLAADILYKKYVLGLPLYRIERDYLLCDLTLSRQTMSNWVIHFAFGMPCMRSSGTGGRPAARVLSGCTRRANAMTIIRSRSIVTNPHAVQTTCGDFMQDGRAQILLTPIPPTWSWNKRPAGAFL